MNKRIAFVIGLFLLVIAFSAKITAHSKVDDKESARIFVQKFYDRYLSLWNTAQINPSAKSVHEIALKQRPGDFDGALLEALADDDSAQSKSGDIVGLDFDPFLRCQELWGGYQTGDVKQVGDKFFVDIRNIEKGRPKKEIRNADVRVVAELVMRNKHWIFINFIYPSKGSKSSIF